MLKGTHFRVPFHQALCDKLRSCRVVRGRKLKFSPPQDEINNIICREVGDELGVGFDLTTGKSPEIIPQIVRGEVIIPAKIAGNKVECAVVCTEECDIS